MGTRNLTAVRFENNWRVAQYCQWDGYPSGQGVSILSFVSSTMNIKALKEQLSKVRFLEHEGVDKEFIESYNKNSPEWSNDPDNRTDEQKHWWETYMHRNIGSGILATIVESNDEEMILDNRISFAGGSLFCEWAYVINLDDNTLEVYEGFNKEKIESGWFSGDEFKDDESEYEPVKLVKTYSLDNLPDSDTFVSDLESEDEE